MKIVDRIPLYRISNMVESIRRLLGLDLALANDLVRTLDNNVGRLRKGEVIESSSNEWRHYLDVVVLATGRTWSPAAVTAISEGLLAISTHELISIADAVRMGSGTATMRNLSAQANFSYDVGIDALLAVKWLPNLDNSLRQITLHLILWSGYNADLEHSKKSQEK